MVLFKINMYVECVEAQVSSSIPLQFIEEVVEEGQEAQIGGKRGREEMEGRVERVEEMRGGQERYVRGVGSEEEEEKDGEDYDNNKRNNNYFNNNNDNMNNEDNEEGDEDDMRGGLSSSGASRGKRQYVDITEYLTLPQSDAAVKLGLPVSTLSKRWKESAKNRKWPFRKVSKIDKEIATLLQFVPQTGPEAGHLSPDIEQQLGSLLRQRQDELRRVTIRL